MAAQITPDKDFEKSCAQLAFSRIADRCPALVDYTVGVQLLDSSEDQKSATIIVGVKLGDEWLYLPMFYRSGDLKGSELGYVVKSDFFFPTSEDWIYYLLGKKRFSLGGKSDRSIGDVTRFDSTDLFNMRRSPLQSKYASAVEINEETTAPDFHARAGEKIANVWLSGNIQPWAVGCAGMVADGESYIDQVESVENMKMAGLVHHLNAVGPARARAALTAFNSEPKMAAALAHFYPESELSKVNTWSDRLSKQAAMDKWAATKAENEKVTIFKRRGLDRLPDSIAMSADEKRKFLQGEIVVKDQRGGTSLVIEKGKDFHTNGSGQLGVQDVIMADGSTARCIALAKKDRYNRGSNSLCSPCGAIGGSHSHGAQEAPRYLVFIDSQKGYIVADKPYAAVEHYDEWYTFGDKSKVFTATDGVKAGKCYAMAMNDRTSLGLFHIVEAKEERGARIIKAHQIDDWSGYLNEYRGEVKNATHTFFMTDDGPHAINENKNIGFSQNDTIVLNRYACRWVPVSETGSETNDSYTKTHYGNKVGVLDGKNINEVIFGSLGAEIVRLQSTGNEYTVADGETKTAGLSRLQAMVYLTKVAGIHADTAESMLKQAEMGEELASRATFYVRRADLYAKQADIQELIRDTVKAPSVHLQGMNQSIDSSSGLPTTPESKTFLDVPSARTSPKGDPASVYDQDPKKLEPTQVDAAVTAQKQDQKELFDASALNYLIEADDLDQEIDGMLGDMILGMDKVGRTYFLFLQHTDDFKEIYGDDRLQQFETQLRQTFEKIGDTIMSLKRKWSSRQRSQGMTATELG